MQDLFLWAIQLSRSRTSTKAMAPWKRCAAISFAAERGEVFGLLGPNGAGKTSTVEILEGLRTADRGLVRVCGLDPSQSGHAFQEKIGAVLQSTSLPDKLRVDEAIELFARFYHRRANTGELLERFQLTEKRGAYYSHLSGGQKQRLALAMALVNDPEVIFLDEPTAGLDPQVRREIYDIIEELKRGQKTVLLTTHYIEEAERLCDRVAIVDHGRVMALGTPRELKHKSAGTTRIEVRLARPIKNGLLGTPGRCVRLPRICRHLRAALGKAAANDCGAGESSSKRKATSCKAWKCFHRPWKMCSSS